MAVGAQRRNILSLILSEGLKVVVVGLVVGTGAEALPWVAYWVCSSSGLRQQIRRPLPPPRPLLGGRPVGLLHTRATGDANRSHDSTTLRMIAQACTKHPTAKTRRRRKGRGAEIPSRAALSGQALRLQLVKPHGVFAGGFWPGRS